VRSPRWRQGTRYQVGRPDEHPDGFWPVESLGGVETRMKLSPVRTDAIVSDRKLCPQSGRWDQLYTGKWSKFDPNAHARSKAGPTDRIVGASGPVSAATADALRGHPHRARPSPDPARSGSPLTALSRMGLVHPGR
jgi:hypothetical protein